MAEQTAEQMIADLDRGMAELGIGQGDPLAVDVNALCPRQVTERDLEEYVAAARAVSYTGPMTLTAAFDDFVRDVEPWK